MIAESIVVLVRQSSHFRVTRALRPIFLLDNHHFGGVRRYLRQVKFTRVFIFEFFYFLIFLYRSCNQCLPQLIS